MTNMNLGHTRRKLAHLMLQRVGTPVAIERPDGTAAENKYGKVTDTDVTYTQVDTDVAYRRYQYSDELPREADVTGGRTDMDNPRIALPRDTNAQADDKVTFADDDKSYILDEKRSLETHYEFTATIVS